MYIDTFWFYVPISIHAPSRERLVRLFTCINTGKFQSTLPRGSDYNGYVYMLPAVISIHAPSRERRKLTYISRKPTDFNPRSLAGATGYNLFRSPLLEFQSTLPRGSDLTSVLKMGLNMKFQSTLPRGSDLILPLGLERVPLFQSTLPRGSDAITLCILTMI